jgi:Kef-type K+ transport system membrane component KefB
MQGHFAEFALLLLICAQAGAALVRLRQPVLIANIVVGTAVGPAGFGLVTAHDQIDLLAPVGVAVLLFAVGLKCGEKITRVSASPRGAGAQRDAAGADGAAMAGC